MKRFVTTIIQKVNMNTVEEGMIVGLGLAVMGGCNQGNGPG